MPTATRFASPSSSSAAYAADSCPLAPSISTRSGNGPPSASSLRYRRSTTSYIAAKSSDWGPGPGDWELGPRDWELGARDWELGAGDSGLEAGDSELGAGN